MSDRKAVAGGEDRRNIAARRFIYEAWSLAGVMDGEDGHT